MGFPSNDLFEGVVVADEVRVEEQDFPEPPEEVVLASDGGELHADRRRRACLFEGRDALAQGRSGVAPVALEEEPFRRGELLRPDPHLECPDRPW